MGRNKKSKPTRPQSFSMNADDIALLSSLSQQCGISMSDAVCRMIRNIDTIGPVALSVLCMRSQTSDALRKQIEQCGIEMKALNERRNRYIELLKQVDDVQERLDNATKEERERIECERKMQQSDILNIAEQRDNERRIKHDNLLKRLTSFVSFITDNKHSIEYSLGLFIRVYSQDIDYARDNDILTDAEWEAVRRHYSEQIDKYHKCGGTDTSYDKIESIYGITRD